MRRAQKKKNPMPFKLLIVLIILFILAAFFAVVDFIDCHRFVVRTFSYASPKIRKDMKVVLLTDLHSVSFGKNNKKLKDAIDALSPDAIIVAGDLYTCSKREDAHTASDLMEYIGGRYTVYYANGNHEQKTKEEPEEFGSLYEDYKVLLLNKNVHLLINDHLDLPEEGIRILGLEIPYRYYRKLSGSHPSKEELTALLGEPSGEYCNLLIAHNPEFFDDYAAWGADLCVSGHVHGGLMRLPYQKGLISPRYRLFPKFSRGIYHRGTSTLLLSCGLGYHTLPVRIFNPGELTVIELKNH